MKHYICIHGHFYQPPRENPWLEEIELQDSAYPFHDWNDRIATECYAANAMSRILDNEGRIARIVNNYVGISFNFGPTLLAWMADKTPETYRRIIEADEASRERFSGHGSAIAQAYNHMILPLATRRDKVTQVKWGIADFVNRFGRDPEGMWLPETAVDIETLEVLAEEGIKYTILAPRQAEKFRTKGHGRWSPVKDHHIDATRAYLQRLPSGRSIDLFFYDGPISQGIAFERLLTSGATFAERLAGALPKDADRPHLVNIATDGETYGHHHRHGDMALAFALAHLDAMPNVHLTNYGEFLEQHPPTFEVQIIENSSWSCVHGVERWRSDCGCHTGGHGDWNQAWRQHLRDALDWLRDRTMSRFDDKAGELLKDVTEATHDYIDVILDRSDENVRAYLNSHASSDLSDEQRITVLQLMELHRNLQLMYTSCGWFFDDLSGIETVQVVHYAARALHLARQVFGEDDEPEFLDRLEAAQSNLPEHGNGRQIYLKWVRPAQISLVDVGGHYAISSLFDGASSGGPAADDQGKRVFCFSVNDEDYRMLTSGRVRLAIGRARISSIVTHESKQVSFGALHLGDHNLMGSARSFRGQDEYNALLADLAGAFENADIPETIRALDRHFGEDHRYTVMSVFRDNQRKILERILDTTLEEVERAYRAVYENSVSLMRSLSGLGAPLPDVLRRTAEFILNMDLRREFEAVHEAGVDIDRIKQMFEETRAWRLDLDTAGLSFALQKAMEALAESLADHPDDMHLLEQLDRAATVARALPFEVDLWKTQNVYYDLGRAMLEARQEQRPQDVIGGNGEWLEYFRSLGEKLQVGV